jgi:hypothetical protein
MISQAFFILVQCSKNCESDTNAMRLQPGKVTYKPVSVLQIQIS